MHSALRRNRNAQPLSLPQRQPFEKERQGPRMLRSATEPRLPYRPTLIGHP
jgi:hypothetical protein